MNQPASVNHNSELKSSIEEFDNVKSLGQGSHNMIEKDQKNQLDATFASPGLNDSSSALIVCLESPVLGLKHRDKKLVEVQEILKLDRFAVSES